MKNNSSRFSKRNQQLHALQLDINSKSWLSNFKSNSICYAVVMFLFYHGLSLLLGIVIPYIIYFIYPQISPYPKIPYSIIQLANAGPSEDTFFFGIPFYTFGNTYVSLVSGGLWLAEHAIST